MAMTASLIAILLAFPLGVLLFLIVSLRRKNQHILLRFTQGVAYVKSLRNLLTLIQQHRGLTTGFINGNLSAEPDIAALAAKIKTTITDIEASGNWIRANLKWFSLTDHWTRLGLSYSQGDSDKNFKQHNILIANLLYLIDDVADAHHLPKVTNSATNADWRYLLSIAEYIGQARALGTGVAAKGECSSVLRIQLNHLRNKIEASIEASWPKNSRLDIQQLLRCIETQLIVERPSIQADDYFSLATRCIGHVLNQFDHQIDCLQHRT